MSFPRRTDLRFFCFVAESIWSTCRGSKFSKKQANEKIRQQKETYDEVVFVKRTRKRGVQNFTV